MTLTITPVFAGLLAIMYVYLSRQVIVGRRANKVSLGDGNITELQRRCRAHGNFAEYVPMILLLMGFAEITGTPSPVVLVIGSLLVLGRLSHAYGISRTPDDFKFRVAGMGMTFAALITGALANLGFSGITAAVFS